MLIFQRALACGLGFFGLVAIDAAIAETPNLAVSLTPEKESFLASEPIAIRLCLKNMSSQMLSIAFRYPISLGLQFSCDDADAVPRGDCLGVSLPSRVLFNPTDGRIPIITIPPGEEFGVVFALNRYFQFRKPKRYTIHYVSGYQERATHKTGDLRTFKSSGDLVIEIGTGALGKVQIGTFQRGLDEQNDQKLRKSVEMLLWVADPAVIESLGRAARILPEAGADIVEALGKFAAHRQAQSVLFETMISGEANVLPPAFCVCASNNIPVPDAVYAQLLSSKDEGKRFFTLRNLLKYGEAKYRPLVEPLKEDPNPNVANLAKQLLIKMGN